MDKPLDALGSFSKEILDSIKYEERVSKRDRRVWQLEESGNYTSEELDEIERQWKITDDPTVDGKERYVLQTKLLELDPRHKSMMDDARKKKKEDVYHEIARKLSEKSGFLFSAREFIKEQPIYYDESQIWWLWNKKDTRWELADETKILNIITVALRNYNVGDASVKYKTNMLEALRQEGRLNKPKDFPKEWIQFKDKFYDLKSKQSFDATSEYFCVNPIPWSIADTDETPTISKLFDEWVGPEHTQTLYEIIAYLCYTDYPIHLIFCLVGSGRNGKSKLQGLIRKFIGEDNLCSTELETLIDVRFESFKLYKKLGCLLGETNFNTIRNTSLLKRLTGQDLVGFEAKNKMPFDSVNYAKIIISTNALPTSDDTSDGFYRRWLIINFPNEFPEGKDILSTIPEYEYTRLAKKVTLILPELLDRCVFKKQGTVEERKQRYVETSNPLQIFIKDFCIVGENEKVTYSSFYTKYVQWLSEGKRRVVSRKEFSDMLERAGHEIKKTSHKNDVTGEWETGRFILGLSLKQGLSAYMPDVPDVPVVSISPLRVENQFENREYRAHGGNSPFKPLFRGELSHFPILEDSVLSKNTVISVIRKLGDVTYEDLQSLIPGEPDLEIWIKDLLSSGDIFEHRPGRYKVLE